MSVVRIGGNFLLCPDKVSFLLFPPVHCPFWLCWFTSWLHPKKQSEKMMMIARQDFDVVPVPWEEVVFHLAHVPSSQPHGCCKPKRKKALTDFASCAFLATWKSFSGNPTWQPRHVEIERVSCFGLPTQQDEGGQGAYHAPLQRHFEFEICTTTGAVIVIMYSKINPIL